MVIATSEDNLGPIFSKISPHGNKVQYPKLVTETKISTENNKVSIVIIVL